MLEVMRSEDLRAHVIAVNKRVFFCEEFTKRQLLCVIVVLFKDRQKCESSGRG
jgi:hypothetical protein